MKEFEPAKKEYESSPIPAELDDTVRAGIRQGKMVHRARRAFRRSVTTVAACFALLLVSLNVSPTFARAAADVPVVGALCRVLTVRSFASSEDQANYHVNVPGVQGDSPLARQVNAEIAERVDAHLAEAKQTWEEYHKAFLSTGGTEEEWSQREMEVIVNYDLKSQTDTTVSFVVNQFVGTFNAYNEQYFYNLNLAEDRDITLQDLLGEDWVTICNAAIQAQIDASADADGFTYFFPAAEGGFSTVDEMTSFYINADGTPVVVFPRYSIAAGAAGATEFPISK
ncbi:MAG: DUF3298 domain-containing protein [Oscillibacter sp.]